MVPSTGAGKTKGRQMRWGNDAGGWLLDAGYLVMKRFNIMVTLL